MYNTEGKAPKVRSYYKKSGVYLIKEKGLLVYVGFSQSNMYKTAMRHFQSWDDPTQARVTYAGNPKSWYTIRLVQTSPAKAHQLEMALIMKHQPRDNDIKYQTYLFTDNDKKLIKEYEEAPF